jgi:hypothetical protein
MRMMVVVMVMVMVVMTMMFPFLAKEWNVHLLNFRFAME